MRSVRLAQIAAQAEGLRLRRRVSRVIMQVVLALVAVPFLIATLVFLELALWKVVAANVLPVWAALIVAGVNLIIAGIVLILAMTRGGDDRVAIEALQVRQRAFESAQRSLSLAALVAPVSQFLLGRLTRRRKRR
ncbi:MAG: hypothetical protein M3Y41_07160 [Pseudomonadota bacterium]|nr:hypothetical protein [Pseudomonadota bacterium]